MNAAQIRHKYATRAMPTINVLQFFGDAHLHAELRNITTPIRELAFEQVDRVSDGPELTVALRHLLDAKESFVRHYLAVHNFALTPQKTTPKTV